MRVLVACEFSGIVREAFRAADRGRMYQGIANAMAEQWGNLR